MVAFSAVTILSFRLRGVSDALTLSMLPSSQIPLIEKSLAELKFGVYCLIGEKTLPEPLGFIHSKMDVSSRINESSLRLMLHLLLEIIQEYRHHVVS